MHRLVNNMAILFSIKTLRNIPVLMAILLVHVCTAQTTTSKRPNIIIVYIDDLGYGDVGCYGATKVKTPHVDFLAANGLKFTDAHCGASTCTPSRFSILTGIYAFRNNAAVLPGDAPLIIKPGTITLPSLLQQAGYTTAVIGKWHLGLGNGTIDWNKHIAPGPNETGFNYSFIIPATTDRVPVVYVENGNVVNLDKSDPITVSYSHLIGDEPTGLDHSEMLKVKADSQHSNTIVNGISRIGFMTGGKKARWVDEDIADVLTAKAISFINQHKQRPFFLYFAVPDIHVPRAPHQRFAGSTTMGRRGDVITEMDWMTGEITKTIEKLGLKNNTLIIFSSDNGPVLDDGYYDEAIEKAGNHDPSGGFRGGKYSAFEAGTRVPMIAYWPGTIQAGVSNALFTQVDLPASFAALAGVALIPGAVPDSRNMMNVLLGKSTTGREYMLEESYTLSLRNNEWKYIAPQENGTPYWLRRKKIETGLIRTVQLYNLKDDPGEKNNVADRYHQLVQQLQQELDKIKK
jgi:arylsulfatase A